MEASHHKSFTQIGIHSKQQQVEVPLINVFFMLAPVLNAPEKVSTLKYYRFTHWQRWEYTHRELALGWSVVIISALVNGVWYTVTDGLKTPHGNVSTLKY